MMDEFWCLYSKPLRRILGDFKTAEAAQQAKDRRCDKDNEGVAVSKFQVLIDCPQDETEMG